MDDVVEVALAAMRQRDRDELTRVLHPYLHWTVGGTTIRGRRNVLAHLETAPPPDPPASYELRDHQIYRWTSP